MLPSTMVLTSPHGIRIWSSEMPNPKGIHFEDLVIAAGNAVRQMWIESRLVTEPQDYLFPHWAY